MYSVPGARQVSYGIGFILLGVGLPRNYDLLWDLGVILRGFGALFKSTASGPFLLREIHSVPACECTMLRLQKDSAMRIRFVALPTEVVGDCQPLYSPDEKVMIDRVVQCAQPGTGGLINAATFLNHVVRCPATPFKQPSKSIGTLGTARMGVREDHGKRASTGENAPVLPCWQLFRGGPEAHGRGSGTAGASLRGLRGETEGVGRCFPFCLCLWGGGGAGERMAVVNAHWKPLTETPYALMSNASESEVGHR